MSERQQHAELSKWVAVTLLAAIFGLDLFTPVGVLIPVLYVAPLVVALMSGSRLFFVSIALAATALTVAGYVYSPPGGVPWIVLLNRLLAASGVAVATAAFFLYEESQRRYAALREFLPQCSACKKVRLDGDQWTTLEAYLEQHGHDRFLDSFCPRCTDAYSRDLKDLRAAREAAADSPSIA